MTSNESQRDAASGLAAAGGAERPPLPNLDAAPGSPDDGAGAGARALATGLDFVLDVPVRLSVELGRTEIPIRDVVNIGRGSIIELDGTPGAPLDVRVNGVLIGRGEIVVINEERLGLRFVEVVSEADPANRLR
jgi:flagellar motor switch protein FliN